MKEIEKLNSQELEVSQKKAFLEKLEERYKEDFLPQEWTDKQKEQVIEMTNKENTKIRMLTSIPMICRASKCDFKETCELYQMGQAPLGQRCPYEFALVRHLMADYVDQLGIDIDNTVEVSQVRDIVNQEVQMLRANNILAQESFIQENVVGVDSEGDPIFKKELHLAVELEERLHKRRQMFFKSFLATRQERAKAGVAAIDSAQGMANLMKNFREIEQQQQQELKKQLGIADVDEYIEAMEAKKRDEEE